MTTRIARISSVHRRQFLAELGHERRSFLKSAVAAAGGISAAAGGLSLVTPAMAQAAEAAQPAKRGYHYLPATAETVHWGYFSKLLKPQLEVESGDLVTIEALTHHANDDAERMIKGDPGAESVFLWTKDQKNVNRRGAGPMDASIYGRGAGEGFGVHICTGPVDVKGAEPGDVLEVRILDVTPAALRPIRSIAGKAFGSNAAAWWGFHYNDLMTEPKPREVVTIYEVDATGERSWAKAVYNFRWVPQTDPFGVVHKTIDYPGVPVDHSIIKPNFGILKNVRIPIRPHFGVMALAPREVDMVDSIPPGYFGGNIDNWRIGKGATMYYPVAVEGALLSVGDPHAVPGRFRAVRHGHRVLAHRHVPAHRAQESGHWPARRSKVSTSRCWKPQDDFVVHGFTYANYLAELGPDAQVGDLRQVLGRPRDARRVPQDAPVPDARQRPHRGRGDLADVGRRRFRHHPGRRRQLGRPRHHPEGHLLRRRRLSLHVAPLPLTPGRDGRRSSATLRRLALKAKSNRSPAIGTAPRMELQPILPSMRSSSVDGTPSRHASTSG